MARVRSKSPTGARLASRPGRGSRYSAGTASVHATGTNRRSPLGNSSSRVSSSFRTACVRTGTVVPASGWDGRVIATDSGSSSRWVVCRVLLDNIDHSLLLKALRRHTDERWILLYIERWLGAEVEMPDGTREARNKGTPQGGVISPLISNLFLHYTFDAWMRREFPSIPFERYADDAVCHCRSKAQADNLRAALERRFAECGLELHPEKTKAVYCKDGGRTGDHPVTSFGFLGYTFRARRSKNWKGKYFVNFSPAVSGKATKAVRREVRAWKLPCRSDMSLDDLARAYNAAIRGWVNYYGAYYKSALYPTLRHIDRKLVRWATRKFKGLRRHRRRAAHWLRRIARRDLDLFAHWRLIYGQGRFGGAG